MSNVKILTSLFILIFVPTKAFAYLDPGKGSIILQAILGFIAASIATISIYWTKFKTIISKIFTKKKYEKDKKKSND